MYFLSVNSYELIKRMTQGRTTLGGFTFTGEEGRGGHLSFSQRPAMDSARELDQWVKKMKCSGATGLDITSFPEIKVASQCAKVPTDSFSIPKGWTGLISSGSWKFKFGPVARRNPFRCNDARARGRGLGALSPHAPVWNQGCRSELPSRSTDLYEGARI